MLAASGRLNLKAGGPSVMVPVDPELTKLLYKPSQWQVPARDPAEYDRRSIYLFAKRNLRLPFMETFDAPASLTSCARRESSTHAPAGPGDAQRPPRRTTSPPPSRDGWRGEATEDPAGLVDRAFLARDRPAPDDGGARRSPLAFLRDQTQPTNSRSPCST